MAGRIDGRKLNPFTWAPVFSLVGRSSIWLPLSTRCGLFLPGRCRGGLVKNLPLKKSLSGFKKKLYTVLFLDKKSRKSLQNYPLFVRYFGEKYLVFPRKSCLFLKKQCRTKSGFSSGNSGKNRRRTRRTKKMSA